MFSMRMMSIEGSALAGGSTYSPRRDIESPVQSESASGNVAGEHVVAAFGRLGIEPSSMAMRAHAVEDLHHLAPPCVVILRDYTGVALEKALGNGAFEALTAQGKTIVHAQDIAPRYSGHVVALAKPEAAPAPTSMGDEKPPVSPAGGTVRELVLHIAAAVLTARMFHVLIVLAVMANLFVFALPVYSMAVYDRIIPHNATETLIALTFGILIVLGIDLLCRVMRARIQEAISLRISLDLQWMLFQRLLKADYVKAPRSAAMMQSAFGAVESACLLAPTLIVGVLVDLPFLLVTLGYVAYLAQWVVVPPLVTIGLIVLANIVAHSQSRKAYITSARMVVDRQNMLEETVQGLASVKSAGAGAQIGSKYSQLIDDIGYFGYEGRHANARAGQVANTVLQLCTVASLAVGVILINNGTMSVGALVAATLLTGRAIAPVNILASSALRAASLAASLEHSAQLARLPQEEAGDPSGVHTVLKGDIRLANVSLRYPNEPRLALKDVSLSIKAGERVGLIGRIGCGKSSLLQMLARLLTPETGTIMLDEHDIRQYDPAWIRRQIAYMQQDCELVDGTIRDNILRGIEGFDDLAFQEAVRISGVKDIVASHPKGYALEVGRRSRQLSGGERQAVCLARTLVRQAPVLVLDEPTTAMDNQLEIAVVNRLRDYVQGRTLVLATHRTPLLALVTRVIWLDEGRILADGPRDEVIARVSRHSA